MSERQAEYAERDEHLVTDRKVCPLMSAPVEGVDCVQERCAWWTGTECAVAAIARSAGRKGMDIQIKPPAVPGL